MTSEIASEVVKNAISANSRNKLVTYFLSICMDMYEKNWQKTEQLFSWITEEDYKEYIVDKKNALKSVLKDDGFISDVNRILSLENDLHSEEMMKKKLANGRPKKVLSNFNIDNLKTVKDLLLHLPKYGIYDREARMIKQKLILMGYKLKRGRRKSG